MTDESLMGAAYDHHLATIRENAATISRLTKERDDLRRALERLDAFFDFGETLNDKEACLVEYSPDLQAAFEAAHIALTPS